MKKYEKEFDKYITNFDKSIKQVRYKYHHSYEVSHLMEELSNRLKLSKEKTRIATIIGLLHDIGRFPQAQKYGICSDEITKVDHASLGNDYLFRKKHIRDFIKTDKYDDIIECAIENHNKYEIKNNVNNKNLLFCKMIRDTDKIDILRVISLEYTYTYDKSNVSQGVKESFNHNQTILNKKVLTESDRVLALSALVFDINYKESLELLIEKKYLDAFFDCITPKDDSKQELKQIKEYLNKYIKEKLKC